MKRHVFNLSVPDSIYTVIKDNKKHRLPTKSFFLETFLYEIDKVCEGNPEKVAEILRQIFLNGLKLEVMGGQVKVSVSSQALQKDEKKSQDIKTKLRKIERMYDISQTD